MEPASRTKKKSCRDVCGQIVTLWVYTVPWVCLFIWLSPTTVYWYCKHTIAATCNRSCFSSFREKSWRNLCNSKWCSKQNRATRQAGSKCRNWSTPCKPCFMIFNTPIILITVEQNTAWCWCNHWRMPTHNRRKEHHAQIDGSTCGIQHNAHKRQTKAQWHERQSNTKWTWRFSFPQSWQPEWDWQMCKTRNFERRRSITSWQGY